MRDPSLLTRVVGLTKATKETSSRGSVDDATVFLFPEMRPGGARALVGAPDMDLVDEVPVLILHVLEANVPEDTGVVDEDVDASIGLDGRVDNLFTLVYGVVVGHGLSAGSLDLIDDDIGGLEKRRRKETGD